MSRRPTARRFADSGGIPFVGALHPKSRPSPLLAAGLFVVGSLLIVSYLYHGSGSKSGDIAALNRLDGGVSCTLELQRLIPVLKKAYGDSMGKVLHIGPDTCSVVSQLLKEEDTEAWGIEPYELDDADANCRNLVRKGIVHVADIKFPLPYRPKSFSLVIVSDALDYLSPKYLNKTVPELARVSSDGVVMLSVIGIGVTNSNYAFHLNVEGRFGYGLEKTGVALWFHDFTYHVTQVIRKLKWRSYPSLGVPAKFRSSSWWIRFFAQSSLEENEVAVKKFEQAATKKSYKSPCQVFHLKPLH